MAFGLRTRVRPRNHVLHWGPDRPTPWEGTILRRNMLHGVQIPHKKEQLWWIGAPIVKYRHFCRKLCKNGWTDRFAVWVVDSSGPKEAQVQSYSSGEYDWTVCLRRRCGLNLMSNYFDQLLLLLWMNEWRFNGKIHRRMVLTDHLYTCPNTIAYIYIQITHLLPTFWCNCPSVTNRVKLQLWTHSERFAAEQNRQFTWDYFVVSSFDSDVFRLYDWLIE